MADVFISYRRSDRAVADVVAQRLQDDVGLTVWYDRRLKPGTSWHRETDRELFRAKAVLVLWSESATKSNWVLGEARDADRRGLLVSAVISSACRVPIPYDFHCIDLSGWLEKGHPEPFARLLEALAERLRLRELQRFALLLRLSVSRSQAIPLSVEFYDFAEMLRLCEAVRDDVREFDPDVIICPDPRSGLWGEMLFDWLQRRVPVLVGYRYRSDDLVAPKGFLRVSHGHCAFFIPELIRDLERNKRVLFVNDRSPSFAEEIAIKTLMCSDLGWLTHNVRTLTLVAGSIAKDKAPPDATFGVVADAAEIKIFYDDALTDMNK